MPALLKTGPWSPATVAVAKDRDSSKSPVAIEEAVEFLLKLSGSVFQFVTSRAVLRSDTGRMLSAVDTSEIRFRPLIEREIRDYVRRHPVLQYAGAFDGDGVLSFGESISASWTIFTAVDV